MSDKEPYICRAHFSYKLLGIWETAHLLASHQRFYTSNYSNIHLHFAINYSHFNNNTSANVNNVMTITTSIKHWNGKSRRILNTDVDTGLIKSVNETTELPLLSYTLSGKQKNDQLHMQLRLDIITRNVCVVSRNIMLL